MDGITAVTLAADTWGIPSRQFLFGYLLTAIVAVVASLILRVVYMRGIARTRQPVGVLSPAEMGMLFGDRRAVLAALAHLRSLDLVDSTGRVGRALTAQDRDLDAFTRCVYDRIAESGSQNILRLTNSLTVPLAQLRASLVQRGLLSGPEQRSAARMAAVPIFIVLAVGIARIVAGIANGKPIWGLVFIIVPLAILGLLVSRSRRRTGGGTGELMSAVGGRRTGGGRYDRTHPGIAAAIGGGAALWLFDSTLAGASGVSSSDGGGSFWSSASSDGGSSSGDSGGSSCSSGSSCGGGGGCGGGCGG